MRALWATIRRTARLLRRIALHINTACGLQAKTKMERKYQRHCPCVQFATPSRFGEIPTEYDRMVPRVTSLRHFFAAVT